MREAAWLSDGTYCYEEVVRMLGELVAVLKGDVQVRKKACTNFMVGVIGTGRALTQMKFLISRL